jgi:hypothetical protein
MNNNIRLKELSDKEIYIDVNDLIIEMLLKADNANNESEKRVYKEIADRLSNIRNKAHKTNSHI